MTTHPNTFPKSLHIRGPAAFKAIYDAGHRETLHPLVALAVASDLPVTRIGFSVPKKVGNAVRRNRVRRLLREAVRLSKPLQPPGLDVVILVRPHEFKTLAEYQALASKLWDRLRTRAAKSPLPRPAAPARRPKPKPPTTAIPAPRASASTPRNPPAKPREIR